MNRLLTLCGVALFTLSAQAQTVASKPVVFGKIDIADLEMAKCDFEPDAIYQRSVPSHFMVFFTANVKAIIFSRSRC